MNTYTYPSERKTDFTLMWPYLTAKWRQELASLSILFKIAEHEAPTWLAEKNEKENLQIIMLFKKSKWKLFSYSSRWFLSSQFIYLTSVIF